MSMMRSTAARSIAVTAATAGLALGSLALAPSGPASAATAPVEASYTCTTPSGASFQLPADVSLLNLPETLAAGVTVPAGVPFTLGLDSSALTSALGTNALAANYSVGQLSTQVGTTAVTSTVSDPVLTQRADGLLGINGILGSFAPDPSSLGLPIPTSFNLVSPANGVVGTTGTTPCTLNPASVHAPGAAAGSGNTSDITVVKQTAKVKAHQIGKRPKLLVKVKNQTGNATGKMVAKLRGKRVGKGMIKQGKLRLSLKRLKHGVNRVKLSYAGDAITQPAHKTVRVKIVRRGSR